MSVKMLLNTIKFIYSFLWRTIVVFIVFFVFFALWLFMLNALGDNGVFVYHDGLIFGAFDFLGLDIIGFALAICVGLVASWLLNKRKLKLTLFFLCKVAGFVGILLLTIFCSAHLMGLCESNKINRFIKNADEVLYYGDGDIVVGGIKKTQFEENVILIDYDSMHIAFLFRGDLDEYKEYKLIKSRHSIDNPNLQIKAKLNAPGALLTSYYPNESNEHRTTAIQLILEDGSIYSLSDMKDEDTGFECYLGLKWSQYNVKGED